MSKKLEKLIAQNPGQGQPTFRDFIQEADGTYETPL
jgi:hypothetical protein